MKMIFPAIQTNYINPEGWILCISIFDSNPLDYKWNILSNESVFDYIFPVWYIPVEKRYLILENMLRDIPTKHIAELLEMAGELSKKFKDIKRFLNAKSNKNP